MADEATAAVAAPATEAAPADAAPAAGTPEAVDAAVAAEVAEAEAQTPEGLAAAKAKADAAELAKREEQALARAERKEQIALRQAKQADKRRKWELSQQEARISAKEAELNARLKALETADPFEVSAKTRGKSREQVIEEENYRLLNEDKAKAADVERTREERLARLEAELAAEKKEKTDNFAKWEQQRKLDDFNKDTAAEAAKLGKKALPLVHTHPAERVHAEVLSRMDAEYRKSGTRLDKAAVLGKIESELRAELKAKLAAVEEAERHESGAPDRGNGAVTSPQGPEATTNANPQGPQTLTASLASQTAGRTRSLTAKQRNAEADELIFGRRE